MAIDADCRIALVRALPGIGERALDGRPLRGLRVGARTHSRGGRLGKLDRLGREELLDLSFARLARLLGADLAETPLAGPIGRLFGELDAKGLGLRPDLWLSTDFFSPDGVNGFAIPFHLAHPKLVALERREMGSAEGAQPAALLRLLRHEAGHAFENAFVLGRRRDWREVFGRRSLPYRQSYRAEPASTDFVRNLPLWYAQSHPAEDFAESFAVWLAPRSREHGALSERARAKLASIEEFVRGAGAPRRERDRVHRISILSGTLREHYERRRRRRRREPLWPFEEFLRGSFVARDACEQGRLGRAASPVLRARFKELEGEIPRRWRGDRYSLVQIRDAMETRAHALDLRLPRGAAAPTLRSLARATARTLDTLQRGEAQIGR